MSTSITTTDVMFSFSTETLADANARGFCRPPDRLLLTLASEESVGRLLITDATRWLPSRLLRCATKIDRLRDATHARPWRLRRREAVSVTDIQAEVHRRDRYLKTVSASAGLVHPAVVSFDPFLAAFGSLDWAGPVTYYARDDWATFPPRRNWWPAYESAYETLRDMRRGVLAVSETLLERLAPTGPSAAIVNGIDDTEWLDPAPPPAWFADLAKPVAVYVGTIDDRVDPDAIVAATTTGATVLLVGPANERFDSRVLTTAGVHHFVASDRSELASIVFASNIGLIPHRRTRLTEAMSPLKLFEYRAAGLPVASVRLQPVALEASSDPAIILAPSSGSSGFAEAVRRALKRGNDRETTRLATIRNTSWTERHRRALTVILR